MPSWQGTTELEGGHSCLPPSPGPPSAEPDKQVHQKNRRVGPHPRQHQVRSPTAGVKRTFILNLRHTHGSSKTLKKTCPHPQLGDPSPRFVSPTSQKFLPCDHVMETAEKAVPRGTGSRTHPGPHPLPWGSCLALPLKDRSAVLGLHHPGLGPALGPATDTAEVRNCELHGLDLKRPGTLGVYPRTPASV